MTTVSAQAALDALDHGALVRRVDLGTIVVRGADRTSWLNGLVTSNLAKLRPGQGTYGLFCQKNGKILADAWILAGDEALWVAVPREGAERLAAGLDHYLIMEDATLEVSAEEHAAFVAFGPKSAAIVDLARRAGGLGATTARAGSEAAFVLVPASAHAAWDAALRADTAFVEASDDAWRRARVALGVPEWGVDFDGSNYPQEAALEGDAVAFDKGCYLGQEAVFMLEKRGRPSKRLVQLEIDGPAAPGDAIATDEPAAVGVITSAVSTPGGALALGYVKYKHARAGERLVVGGHAARLTGLLVPTSGD
jgi:folate-binding protein YgfZ